MKILITTFGTRGDIQPFIALGMGLKAAGYNAALCTSEGFRSMVEAHGLAYLPVDNELLRLTQSALRERKSAFDSLKTVRQMVPAMRRSMDDEWHAAITFQPDLLIYHPKCLGSYHVAEKLGIPAILSVPLPFTETSEFAMPFFAEVKLGSWFNRFSYQLVGMASGMYTGTINDFRTKTLQLPRVGSFHNVRVRSDGSPVPAMLSFSPHVVPVPKDYPEHVHVTGYWFLDRPADWQPEPELVHFLEA